MGKASDKIFASTSYVQRTQKGKEARLAKHSGLANNILDELWKPQEGPQTQAYNHPADELLFGGAAGGVNLRLYSY